VEIDLKQSKRAKNASKNGPFYGEKLHIYVISESYAFDIHPTKQLFLIDFTPNSPTEARANPDLSALNRPNEAILPYSCRKNARIHGDCYQRINNRGSKSPS